MSACSKIRHIVRLRQMLRRWRKRAAMGSAARRSIPSDVPAGHVAVCVGAGCRRFVVRASYLNHPLFRKLLVQAEEEYGFANTGPLTIPCDESVFEEILRYLARAESSNSARFVNLEDFQRYCHLDFGPNLDRSLTGLLISPFGKQGMDPLRVLYLGCTYISSSLGNSYRPVSVEKLIAGRTTVELLIYALHAHLRYGLALSIVLYLGCTYVSASLGNSYRPVSVEKLIAGRTTVELLIYALHAHL
ncbi:hypothetical protein C3L33_09469, partial [Rhododendron williamsianum]